MFDPVAALFAVLYFLGIFQHWIHIKTIFHYEDLLDQMDNTKTIFNSIVWPYSVAVEFFMYTYATITDDEKDQ